MSSISTKVFTYIHTDSLQNQWVYASTSAPRGRADGRERAGTQKPRTVPARGGHLPCVAALCPAFEALWDLGPGPSLAPPVTSTLLEDSPHTPHAARLRAPATVSARPAFTRMLFLPCRHGANSSFLPLCFLCVTSSGKRLLKARKTTWPPLQVSRAALSPASRGHTQVRWHLPALGGISLHASCLTHLCMLGPGTVTDGKRRQMLKSHGPTQDRRRT